MHITLIILLLFLVGCQEERKTLDLEICVDESLISDDDCNEVYHPVCGCDHMTYSNECNAQNAGILSWMEGECD